jgi:hypothetical protein
MNARFFDSLAEAFRLGALGVDEALRALLYGVIETGGDAGLEKQFDDAGDQGLFAALYEGGLDKEPVIEEQMLFACQGFKRTEEPADRLLSCFHDDRPVKSDSKRVDESG